MKCFEFMPEGIEDCKVRAAIHASDEVSPMAQRIRPAVIICPGGGYEKVAEIEAEPVAKPYFAAGYHTFILKYSIGEKAKDFYPLCQLAATIVHVRKHAKEWFVDENKIAVCGFSAGGHLACSLGTLFNEEKILNTFGREEHIRPDAMILSYPVITADEFAHTGSISNVSGAELGSEEYRWFGLDKHVDKETPPTFLWHTAPDQTVPVENSLKMAAALSENKISFEMHIFPEGPHGMSVCTEEIGNGKVSEYNARWMGWSIQWLNKQFDFKV